MSGIYEPQLNSGYSTPVSIRKQHPATEVSVPAQSVHFTNDPSAFG